MTDFIQQIFQTVSNAVKDFTNFVKDVFNIKHDEETKTEDNNKPSIIEYAFGADIDDGWKPYRIVTTSALIAATIYFSPIIAGVVTNGFLLFGTALILEYIGHQLTREIYKFMEEFNKMVLETEEPIEAEIA